ncbi:MAG: hypothetical protein U1E83_08570 [Methylotetracoccus sp.]
MKRICLFYLSLMVVTPYVHAAVVLPYNNSSPVIYDNDSQGDVYAEDLALAMASSGEISLKGMIVTSIIDSPNTPWNYDNAVNFYNSALSSARASGFNNVPASAVRGVRGRLQKPANGLIDSTSPAWTAGGQLIVNEARKCSYAKPLVVVVGGPASTVVDAYLQDKSIADKMVMVWINGAGSGFNRLGEDYNGWADTWALYIAANRLRIVSIPFGGGQVPKARILSDLPNKSFRTFMYNQSYRTADGTVYPGGWDGDGSIVDGLVSSDWMVSAKRVSFLDMYGSVWSRNIARTYDNPNGNILMVTSINSAAQTNAWWRGMSNLRAWTTSGPIGSTSNISLNVSSNPDRSSSKTLQGSSVTGSVYFFAAQDQGVARVQFWLDKPTSSTPTSTENLKPFDFSGSSSTSTLALPFNTYSLATGVAHTLTARATMTDGTVKPAVTATFYRY